MEEGGAVVRVTLASTTVSNSFYLTRAFNCTLCATGRLCIAKETLLDSFSALDECPKRQEDCAVGGEEGKAQKSHGEGDSGRNDMSSQARHREIVK